MKVGSSPATARRELGAGEFQFKIDIDGDQYFCESREVGYAGEYIFLYRNGAFVKVCELPNWEWRYYPKWEFLYHRAKRVIAQPRVQRIVGRPPPADPEPTDFDLVVDFWPLVLAELPLVPVRTIAFAVEWASEQDIRDFYQGRAIQLNQEAAQIDLEKFGTRTLTAKYKDGRLIERIELKKPVMDCLPALDVMVKDGRVVGVFSAG